MTPTAYLESLGYDVEETRGNLYQLWFDGQCQNGEYTEAQLELFAKRKGWTPEEKP